MKNQHDPAFPLSLDQLKRHEDGYYYDAGLTKREYFAIMAMQGILAGKKGSYPPNEVAYCAIQHADELLKQLGSYTEETSYII